MMDYKRYILSALLVFVLFSLNIKAQHLGYEWINTSQDYYRFSIVESGIYRISKSELLNAGVPIDQNEPQSIQLFFKGQEIPCYIEGESGGDVQFIEFFAEKNDGWFDVDMYDDANDQLNPNYSFINDTSSVFITWGSSFTNKRYTLQNDQNFSGYSPLPYCYREVLEQYVSKYYIGASDCEYTEAEGWADNTQINLGASVEKEISTPNLYSASGNARIEWALLTASLGSHHMLATGPGYSFDSIYSGYLNIRKSYTIASNLLSDNNTLSFSSIDDVGASTDKSALAYIKIKYPTNFSFEDELQTQFELAASQNEKQYIEISDFIDGDGPILFDYVNQNRILPTVDGSVVKVLVPSSESEQQLVLVGASGFKQVSEIKACPMVDYSAINKNYLILTHSSLMSEVDDYQVYRDAWVVDADQLYNQFAYGIQKHPLAIRNFTKYILDNASVTPEYMFIIGKGVSASGDDVYSGYRKSEGSYSNCLIPPMGNPSSDVLLTAKTDGITPVSALAMGRLSAQTPIQVANYLSKVVEFESNEAAEWMKHAIHFGGGSNTSEQTIFKSYLQNFERTFEDTLFGGEVSTFLKTSSDPIEITQSDSVESLINSGISLMTFFGHGNTNGFDQNIDEPDAFLNFGKYPLLIANSCHTGNIFFPNNYSTSEDWVLIENKGTIGFLAMTHQGIGTYLNRFTDLFYTYLGQDYYGQPLGKILNATRRNLYENYPEDLLTRNTFQEFLLHGDPGIVLNSFSLPDLMVESKSVTFSPTVLSTEVDSFVLNINAKNIAKSCTDTFAMQIVRTMQSGVVNDTQIIINGLKFKEMVSVTFPIDRINGLGLNSFLINIDANIVVDELTKVNNSVTISTFISSSDLVTTIPYNYSLVPTGPSLLKAVTGDPFAESSTSVFQLDTSAQFNSPFLLSEEVIHTGGVVEWSPSVSYNQNQVYYWRAGKPTSKSDEEWSQSSFSYEDDKMGWIQSDFDQLVDNEYSLIEPNLATEKFDFITTPKRLFCNNVGSPSQSTYYDVRFAIDEITDYSSCGSGGAMLLVVIDTFNLEPWTSDYNGTFLNVNNPKCSSRSRTDYYFVFSDDNTGISGLVDVVDNFVPDGYHILIYSFNSVAYYLWSETNIRAFESWGAANVRFQTESTPYIFYTVKGDVGESIEVLGTSTTDIIDLNVDLETNFVYGNIESVLIGPSQNWEIIEWEAQQIEDNPLEEYFVSMYGVSSSGDEVLIQDSIKDSPVDISGLSTDDYPYAKLKFYTKDEQFKTPTQLKSWSIEYTPLTDLSINPQKGYEFYADTLQQGDVGTMSVAIENIGPVAADSITIDYWLQNSQNENFPLSTHKLSGLEANAFVIDTISFDTRDHSGLMSLWLDVNPYNINTGITNQPEQYHYNNIGNKVFLVEQDNTNPLLDVTFDGVHIMDGDIVSAKPSIVVQLKDENSFIALDDTSTFSLYLKSQQTGLENLVALSNADEVTFIPASLPKNQAQLVYEPGLDEDGIYELRVRAKDASGNESGSFDYQISFQVINESTVTNIFNYPNPFSTSTRFVFELTGSEIPDEIRIDILTVTGKVVKIIYQDDLGLLSIGKNITDYAWDGRDMYGDPLANGVYFYKVSVRLNGEELKNRDTGTGKFFKNGFGKMYLMR